MNGKYGKAHGRLSLVSMRCPGKEAAQPSRIIRGGVAQTVAVSAPCGKQGLEPQPMLAAARRAFRQGE